jgi:hypothetical protein
VRTKENAAVKTIERVVRGRVEKKVQNVLESMGIAGNLKKRKEIEK